MAGADEDWESDDEFERSVLEIDQPTAAIQSQSSSSIVSISKLSKVQPRNSSTPRASTQAVECLQPNSNTRSNNNRPRDMRASVESSTSARHVQSNFPKPSPSIVSSSMKRKRRFPGPAGTLPKLNRNMNLRKLKEAVVTPDSTEDLPEVQMSSQGSQSVSVSCNPTWKMLVQELELSEEHLRFHSIQNALSNACKKRLPDGKVPLLVVVVDAINKTLPDATVTLRDLTDSMQGVIHRVLMKQYREKLKMGSALLLKQTSVFSPSPRRQYLNITPNNLLQIYSEDEKSTAIQSTKVHKSDISIDTLLTQPISCSPVKTSPLSPVRPTDGLFTISKQGHRMPTPQGHRIPTPQGNAHTMTSTPLAPSHVNTCTIQHKQHRSLTVTTEKTENYSTKPSAAAGAAMSLNTRLTNCVPTESQPLHTPSQSITNSSDVTGVDIFGNNDDELSDLDLDDF